MSQASFYVRVMGRYKQFWLKVQIVMSLLAVLVQSANSDAVISSSGTKCK